VVALGGNAMTGPDGRATPESQRAAVELSMAGIADLLAAGHQVIVTHGNGPQVGSLVVQNELARHVVPPVPLDWCVAETQATLGMLIVTALERALAVRGIERQVAALISRVLVDADDPAWQHPTKPIGAPVDEREAAEGTAKGQRFRRDGARGRRRVVPSPEPRELLDGPVVRTLVEQGIVVVAGGGGGIPMIRDGGTLHGVEAVLDKDLTAVLLARAVGADCLVIATDVEHVSTGFGTPAERPVGTVTPAALRALADAGHFASGSMAPKVEAAIRFVTAASTDPGAPVTTGHPARAVITSLRRLGEAVDGGIGTIVEPEPVAGEPVAGEPVAGEPVAGEPADDRVPESGSTHSST
jgi:carbamate kinase